MQFIQTADLHFENPKHFTELTFPVANAIIPIK